ncbi:hypothetical protein NEPAR06_2081 [Nematocida parisii]|nr:hypothetical protein NEPAR06_2081 [Nematocida parisii]
MGILLFISSIITTNSTKTDEDVFDEAMKKIEERIKTMKQNRSMIKQLEEDIKTMRQNGSMLKPPLSPKNPLSKLPNIQQRMRTDILDKHIILDMPDMSDMPRTPDMPDMPRMPDDMLIIPNSTSSTPDISSTSSESSTSSTPDISSTSGTLNMPSIPNTPSTHITPSQSSTHTPSTSGIPSVSGVSDGVSNPKIPSVPAPGHSINKRVNPLLDPVPCAQNASSTKNIEYLLVDTCFEYINVLELYLLYLNIQVKDLPSIRKELLRIIEPPGE